MKTPSRLFVAELALAAALVLPAGAQEQGLKPLELTMTLLPENAIDAAPITRRIELPPAPQPAAKGGAPDDAQNGNNGKHEGADTAAEAREKGREFGQAVAEQAREGRENAGRGADPPGRPDDRGPPDNVPNPPGNPGKP